MREHDEDDLTDNNTTVQIYTRVVLTAERVVALARDTLGGLEAFEWADEDDMTVVAMNLERAETLEEFTTPLV